MNEYGIRPESQPYVCSKCGISFNSRGELFEHKQLIHKRGD